MRVQVSPSAQTTKTPLKEGVFVVWHEEQVLMHLRGRLEGLCDVFEDSKNLKKPQRRTGPVRTKSLYFGIKNSPEAS